MLREAGYLKVRREPLGWETLDCGASRAFAVADHQVAHVYVQRPEDVNAVSQLLRRVDGIEQVLDRAGQAEYGLDHQRAGELVAVAAPSSWFTYYFWLDDALAPDYARTVDIHRKPGYDPVELFLDPKLCCPKLRIAARLARKAPRLSLLHGRHRTGRGHCAREPRPTAGVRSRGERGARVRIVFPPDRAGDDRDDGR